MFEISKLAFAATFLFMSVSTRAAVTNQDVVLVTGGTCESKGFVTISNEDDCRAAVAEMDLSLGTTGRDVKRGCTMLPHFKQGTPVPVFRASGTAGCSHERPGVCLGDPEEELVSACDDKGAFAPDPHTYYTIRSPNGRFLAAIKENGRSSEVWRTPIEGDNLVPYERAPIPQFTIDGGLGTYTRVDDRAHWRFFQKDDGGWVIRNRSTGLNLDTSFDLLNVDDFFIEETWDATCKKNVVYFETESFDHTSNPKDCCEGTFTGDNYFPRTIGTHTTMSIDTITTKCFKKSRSCPAGFEQIERSLCGAFNQLHRLKCRRELQTPLSSQVKQGWFVEEVREFHRAVEFSNQPISTVVNSPEAFVADDLAVAAEIGTSLAVAAGAVALTGVGIPAPLGVAMLGIIAGGVNLGLVEFGVLPEEPDLFQEFADEIGRVLGQFAVDMEARTEGLIGNALARDRADEIRVIMLNRRNWFLREYPLDKHEELANLKEAIKEGVDFVIESKLDEVDDLADKVLKEVDDYDLNIDVFFGLNLGSREDRVRRFDFGLDVIKLALVELSIMHQEGLLLKVLARPEDSCAKRILELELFDEKIKKRRNKLVNAVELLVEFQRDQEIQNSIGCGRFDDGTDLAFRQCPQPSFDEFLFDVDNFSYRIGAQLSFFDNLLDQTLQMCEELKKGESGFRAAFELN